MATSEHAAVSTEQCPECSGRVVADGAESVCQSCGLVVAEDAIDHGPEWRDFDDRDRPRGVATVDPTRQGKGLGSDPGTAAERGRDADLKRQSVQHFRAKVSSKKERNLRYALGEVERMASALDLGDGLAKQAKRLFKQCHDADMAVGNDLDTLAATAVYTTLRINQRGLTPDDVADVARNGNSTDIARWHTRLCDEVGVQAPPPSVAQRIRVVASDAGVSGAARERALERLEGLDACTVSSGSPSTLAAALVYDESGLQATQSVVADAAGVSAAGLRRRLYQATK